MEHAHKRRCKRVNSSIVKLESVPKHNMVPSHRGPCDMVDCYPVLRMFLAFVHLPSIRQQSLRFTCPTAAYLVDHSAAGEITELSLLADSTKLGGIPWQEME